MAIDFNKGKVHHKNYGFIESFKSFIKINSDYSCIDFY